jgi:hypothetical protein
MVCRNICLNEEKVLRIIPVFEGGENEGKALKGK